ncbi:MAG TPA: SRPBCC domain-containing protein [Candidatus Dormibacteraeota bacterium]|nr:SRPBCC domain-containing protein [Candidatus Dormibacteraeota bacterium]
MIDSDVTTAIVDSISIDAPVSKTFAALTDPKQLVQWWGDPSSYQTTHMDCDLRVGGAWKCIGRNANGETFAVYGHYQVVEPPRLLQFTWTHDWGDGAQPVETIVRYELAEREGRTELTVRHWGFTDVEDRDAHERGWKKVLNWLRTYSEAGPAA